jgi:hypothetical protein
MQSPTLYYAQIAFSVEEISQNVSKLADIFANQRERTALDEGIIDGIAAEAGNLISAANALKTIPYTGD